MKSLIGKNFREAHLSVFERLAACEKLRRRFGRPEAFVGTRTSASVQVLSRVFGSYYLKKTSGGWRGGVQGPLDRKILALLLGKR